MCFQQHSNNDPRLLSPLGKSITPMIAPFRPPSNRSMDPNALRRIKHALGGKSNFFPVPVIYILKWRQQLSRIFRNHYVFSSFVLAVRSIIISRARTVRFPFSIIFSRAKRRHFAIAAVHTTPTSSIKRNIHLEFIVRSSSVVERHCGKRRETGKSATSSLVRQPGSLERESFVVPVEREKRLTAWNERKKLLLFVLFRNQNNWRRLLLQF